MASASTSTTLTADELLAVSGRCELLEGVLRMMNPAGALHGMIALEIGGLLREYRAVNGGRVFAAETGFVLARGPDTVRAPDAAYITPAHAERAGIPAGYWPGAPDLAVEVVSPGDTYTEVHEKALGWLGGGAAVVLVVDPDAKHVTRYRSSDDVVVLADEQLVDCDPAMPGFRPSVAALLMVE